MGQLTSALLGVLIRAPAAAWVRRYLRIGDPVLHERENSVGLFASLMARGRSLAPARAAPLLRETRSRKSDGRVGRARERVLARVLSCSGVRALARPSLPLRRRC